MAESERDQERRRLIRVASPIIEQDGHAVCVCGALFLTEDGYADHVLDCEHVKRQQAALGK
jgi:hypothetical protein